MSYDSGRPDGYTGRPEMEWDRCQYDGAPEYEPCAECGETCEEEGKTFCSLACELAFLDLTDCVQEVKP